MNLFSDIIDALLEANELEDRAKKHKKKSKGFGWHMNVDAGDVETGVNFFNNAMGSGEASCSEDLSVEEALDSLRTLTEDENDVVISDKEKKRR